MFAPPSNGTASNTSKAIEANAAWRRDQWLAERERHLRMLCEIRPTISNQVDDLYVSHEYHDRVKALVQRQADQRLEEENIALYKRLNAVNTRRASTQYVNPMHDETKALFLRTKAKVRRMQLTNVSDENQRMVDRLLHATAHVEKQANWKQHARDYELQRQRLNETPRNAYLPSVIGSRLDERRSAVSSATKARIQTRKLSMISASSKPTSRPQSHHSTRPATAQHSHQSKHTSSDVAEDVENVNEPQMNIMVSVGAVSQQVCRKDQRRVKSAAKPTPLSALHNSSHHQRMTSLTTANLDASNTAPTFENVEHYYKMPSQNYRTQSIPLQPM